MTAKEWFQRTGHIKAFESIVLSDAFQIACHYAVLQFVEEQRRTSNPAENWDEHSRLLGAQRVITILQNLYLPEAKMPGLTSEELRYDQGLPYQKTILRSEPELK